jgi:hypothetical protein
VQPLELRQDQLRPHLVAEPGAPALLQRLTGDRDPGQDWTDFDVAAVDPTSIAQTPG